MIGKQSAIYHGWIKEQIKCDYKINECIVLEKEGEYTALRGVVDAHNPIKGVCSICNQHSVVHLFTATVKGNGDNYTSYSNYICNDSQLCNQRVSNYDKLQEFVARNLI